MEAEDYEREYLQDEATIEAERRARMEAEWMEMEHEMEEEEKKKQLPAIIKTDIPIEKKEETENGRA